MKPSLRLLHNACRITLFTRASCSLCTDAKGVLSSVWNRRHFDYREVDVMAPGQEKWKNSYEFDVPVIHVEPSSRETDQMVNAKQKLMHRFTEEEVQSLMDQVQGLRSSAEPSSPSSPSS